MTANINIHGLILAGGKSSRFSLGDKALYPIADKPMIQHVIERLQPQVDSISISCNSQPQVYLSILHKLGIKNTLNNMPLCISDTLIKQPIGPIAGIYEYLSQLGLLLPKTFNDRHLVMICSCDMPYIPDDIVEQLLYRIQSTHAKAAYAVDKTTKHYLLTLVDPLSGLEHLQHLSNALKNNDRKLFSIHRWLNSLNAVEVPIHSEVPLININSTADVTQFLQRHCTRN